MLSRMTATTEPTTLTAGDTVAWSRSLPDYPASGGWVLGYALVNAASRIDIVSTALGDSHQVAVSAAVTGAWAAGRYDWQAFVTRAGERHTVGKGAVLIAPNLAGAGVTVLDTRTPARVALDAADAALRTYGAKAYLQSYSIGGRQQTFRSPSEFMAFRSRLKMEVAREEASEGIKAGRPRRNTVAVRFRT